MSVRNVVWCWVLVGCGGEDPRRPGRDRDPVEQEEQEQEQEQEQEEEEAPPFECYGVVSPCDPGTEYCIESWLGSNAMAGTCAPLPEDCYTCDCVLAQDIEQVWFEEASATDNCSGAILLCEQENDRIRLICQK